MRRPRAPRLTTDPGKRTIVKRTRADNPSARRCISVDRSDTRGRGSAQPWNAVVARRTIVEVLAMVYRQRRQWLCAEAIRIWSPSGRSPPQATIWPIQGCRPDTPLPAGKPIVSAQREGVFPATVGARQSAREERRSYAAMSGCGCLQALAADFERFG